MFDESVHGRIEDGDHTAREAMYSAPQKRILFFRGYEKNARGLRSFLLWGVHKMRVVVMADIFLVDIQYYSE